MQHTNVTPMAAGSASQRAAAELLEQAWPTAVGGAQVRIVVVDDPDPS